MDTPKLSDVKFKDDILHFDYKILQTFAKVNFLPSNLKKSHLAEVIAAHNSGNNDLVIEKINFVMEERYLNRKPNTKKRVLPTIELINKYLNKTHSKRKHGSAKKSLLKSFNMETGPERTNNTNIMQTRSMNKTVVSHSNETKPDVTRTICVKKTAKSSYIQAKVTQNLKKTSIQIKSISKLTNNNDELKKKEAYLREISLIDKKASAVPNIKTKNIINSTIDLSYKNSLTTKINTKKSVTNSRKTQPVITIPKQSIFRTTRLPVNKKIIMQQNNKKTTKTRKNAPKTPLGIKFTPKMTSTPKADKQTQYEKGKKQCNAIDRIADIDNHLHSIIMEFCTKNNEELKEEIQPNDNTKINYANDSNYTKLVKDPYVRRNADRKFPVQTLPSIDVAFGKMKEKTPKYMKPLYVHVSTESERYNDVKYYFPIYSNTGNLLLKMSENKNFASLPNTVATSSSVPLTTAYVNNLCLPTSDADTANATRYDNYANQLRISDDDDMVSEEMSHLFRGKSCAKYVDSKTYENEFLEMGTYKNVLKSCEYFEEESWRYESPLYNAPSEVCSMDQNSYSDIAQMVEDALYIASMDVKYMESSGMNIHMQCMKCRWAGPRLLLEHHIRLEHDDLIYKSVDFNWMLAVNLDSVIQRDGLSELIECCEGSIFVVHFKYRTPKLMVSLFSLVEEDRSVCAAISVYPKTVGAPTNWHQVVFMLPPVLSNYAHGYCIFDLADLAYLPKSTVEYNYQVGNDEESWYSVNIPLFISVTFD